MLRTILIAATLSLMGLSLYGQTKVGDNVLNIDPASILELESTSRGFLPSRLTTAQRDLQTEWDRGHIIYNTTDGCLQIYSGSTWECILQGQQTDSTIYKYDGVLTSDRSISMNGSGLSFDGSGDSIIITADGRLGVGDLTPDAKLDVEGGTVKFSDYGTGTIVGSEEYLLGVDSDGDIIEVSPGDVGSDNQNVDTLFLRNDSLFIALEDQTESLRGINLAPYLDNTDNQYIDTFRIVGDEIELSLFGDNSPLSTIDLSPYANTDNQTIDSLGLDGNVLQIGVENDANGLQTLDLSSLTDIDWLAINGSRATSINDSIFTLGRVGIGTNNPAGKLHVSTEGSEDILFTRFDNDVTNDLDLDFIGGEGTSAAPSPYSGLTTGNRMGGIRFRSYIDPASFFTNPLDAFAPIAEVAGETDGTYSTTSAPGRLVFSTTSQGNNRPSERMVIKNDGKVGINISAPDELLHIGGNMRLDNAFEDKDGDAGAFGNILTSTVTGTDWVAASTIGSDDQIIDSLGLNGTELQIDIEDDVNGLQTVDLSPLQGGSVGLHDDVDVTTVTPGSGDVLAWDGANFVPQATDNGYTIFNVWAEEGNNLANNQTEWSFGNGDETPLGHGIVLPIDCELFAMSLDHENGVNTTVRILKNNDASLSAYQIVNTSEEQNHVTFGTPLSFVAGDVVNFETISSSAGGNSGRASAWFRIRSTPASTSLVNDLLDVSAGGITNNQVLIFDGSSFVPLTLNADNVAYDNSTSMLTATTVQEAIDEINSSSSDDQTIDQLSLSGTTLSISLEDDSQPAATVNLAAIDTDTDEQKIDSFGLTGNILRLSLERDGEAPLAVDLSSITGTSDNIYNTNGTLDANRTVTMDSRRLTFDGSARDLTIASDGALGIGIAAPAAPIHIFEATGTPASANDGSLILEHNNNGGSSSVVFKSAVNSGSDYGYIQYEDDGSGNGSSSENALLTIGTQNDGVGSTQDDIAIMPSGNLGVGTTSPGAKLDIDGSVRLSAFDDNTYKDTSAHILGVKANGDVIKMNTGRNSRWFYPPAVVIDASDLVTEATLDLHADYVNQFTGAGSIALISSDGASGDIPYYLEDELEYYITFYDDTILDNVSIDANGVMTYDIVAVPFDNYTVINVVFVIK